jgi:putative peptidoglycan lipid II flippase
LSTGIVQPPGSSPNRRIFHAAASVLGAGAIVKIAGTCREFVVAGIYGRTDAMDAFLVAFLIPNLLVNLVAESMNQALIPTWIRVSLREGRDRAQQLLSTSMLHLCSLLTAVSLIMAAIARLIFPLIGSGFAAGKLDLSIRLFYGLLPVVLMTGVASSCTAVLNACERFAVPALAQLVMPVTIVAGALLLEPRFGIWALVYATVLGSILHALLVTGMLRAHGFRLQLAWHGSDEHTRAVSRRYGPVLLSSLVASGGLLVDQAMAAMLPPGSVSALVFATRFVGVAVTLMAGAVSSALAPYLSVMAAEHDWNGCRRTLRTWSRGLAGVSLPMALLLIFGAQPLVRITLQHGAFHSHDTEVVSSVLAMYAIQIPFFLVSRVYYRLIVAMRRTDLVFYCGVLNLGLDVILNLVLMRWLGVAGIALSTSLWSISTLVFLRYWAKKLIAAADTYSVEARA